MAEYNPTTFSEFLTAISDNDTTKVVNCPQNAEWDASELEPEGHTGKLKLYGTINGNGTRIKNLVIKASTYPIFDVNGTTTDLHFTDGVWNCPGDIVRFSYESIMQLCTLSASAQNATSLFGQSGTKATVYRCAANIEVSQTTSAFYIHNYNVIGRYNNIKVSGSKLQTIYVMAANASYRFGEASYCNIVLDTPMVTSLNGGAFNWSLLRCTGSNVTSLAGIYGTGGTFALGCSTDFPNAQGTSGFVLCTEPQLCDAAYLQSLGFPIGV